MTTKCKVCNELLDDDDESETCSSCRARCPDCGLLVDRHAMVCPRAIRARMAVIDARHRLQEEAWRQLQTELIRAHDAADNGNTELAALHLRDATTLELQVFGVAS